MNEQELSAYHLDRCSTRQEIEEEWGGIEVYLEHLALAVTAFTEGIQEARMSGDLEKLAWNTNLLSGIEKQIQALTPTANNDSESIEQK